MNRYIIKILFPVLLIFTFVNSYAQLTDVGIFQLFAKGGISAGGSKIARFSSGNESKLLFEPSFGGGLTINFSQKFQIVAEAIYIKKGVNCRLEYSQELDDIFNISSYASDEIERAIASDQPVAVVWSKNDYIEFPLTLSYTYCKGKFRTRIGGYYAYAVRRRGEFMIIEQGSQSIVNLDKRYRDKHVRRRDMGIKLINEVFFDHYSFSLECSSGLWPVIDPKNPHMTQKSYNMAISLYFNLYF